MDDTIQTLIGTRAIIIQIIPMFTYFSIFALETCQYPSFLLTKNAELYFPPMLITNCFERCRRKEMKELNHKLTAQERGVIWTINIRAIEMYFADSRLIQLIQKVINFITMICLIYFDPFYALAIK